MEVNMVKSGEEEKSFFVIQKEKKYKNSVLL